MSNVLAGIGRGQLKVIDDRVAARRSVFESYRKDLQAIQGISWMPEPKGDFSNRWLTAARLTTESRVSAQELIQALAQENIEARYLWKPMHKQPLFEKASYFSHEEDSSYCDMLFDTGICLPSASSMTTTQQTRVVEEIHRILG